MFRIFLIWCGKVVQFGLRISGHAGSSLPGLIIEKLSPSFLRNTAEGFKAGTIIVSGTNGKTTTTKIIADVLIQSGSRPIVNRSGSNMSRGIVSTLVEHSTWYGRMRGDIGIFEVDEAFVPDVARKLRPRVMLVLNLLRDQLDRYGELDNTAELLAQGASSSLAVILNADDSLVAELGKKLKKQRVHYFGAVAKLRNQLPDDKSMFSKFIGHTKETAHLSRPDSVVLTSAKQLERQQQLTFSYGKASYTTLLPLGGLYNAYNAAAALAVCASLDIDFTKAVQHLTAATPAFGRSERIELSGNRAIELLLVKNPAGFNQVIKTFLLGTKKLPVLMALNDNFADGRDVSWIWDVDFEPLATYEHEIISTGTRAADLTLRLKYAGINSLMDRNMKQALRDFLSELKSGETGYIVPTYTAMLELRSMLGKRTRIKQLWR